LIYTGKPDHDRGVSESVLDLVRHQEIDVMQGLARQQAQDHDQRDQPPTQAQPKIGILHTVHGHGTESLTLVNDVHTFRRDILETCIVKIGIQNHFTEIDAGNLVKIIHQFQPDKPVINEPKA